MVDGVVRSLYCTVDKIGVNDDSDEPDGRKLYHETKSHTFKERTPRSAHAQRDGVLRTHSITWCEIHPDFT